MDNSRLQYPSVTARTALISVLVIKLEKKSQDDASYMLVSPTLPYLKGVAKLKGLQDEVFLHSSLRIGYSDGWGFL